MSEFGDLWSEWCSANQVTIRPFYTKAELINSGHVNQSKNTNVKRLNYPEVIYGNLVECSDKKIK